MTEAAHSLLGYLTTLDFDASRMSNIGKSQQSVSVLKKYAAGAKQFKEYCIKQKINGHSPGRPAHTEKAIERILDYLSGKLKINHNNAIVVWSIYRHACLQYLENECHALFEALRSIKTETKVRDASLFLTELCKGAAALGISRPEVEELCDLWTLRSTPKFDEVIALIETKEPSAVSQRLFERTVIRIETLETSVGALKSELKALESNCVDALEDSGTRAKAQFENLSEEQSKLTKTIEGKLHALNAELNSLRSQFDSLRVDVRKGAENFARNTELDAALTKTNKALAIGEVTTTRQKALEAEYKAFVERYQKSEARTRNADLEKASKASDNYRSPLTRIPTQEIPKTHKRTDEIEFVNAWAQSLVKTQGLYVETEKLLAYHCVLVANQTLLFDEPTLVESWLDCLGWKPWAMNLVASPAWVGEADWAPVANYIFDPWEPNKPRFASIHRYDNALIDCYLLPSVRLWELQPPESCLQKLFLIAETPTSLPDQAIVELAPSIVSSHYRQGGKAKFELTTSFRRLAHAAPIGVDPKAFLKWSAAPDQSTFDLEELEKHLGLTVPLSIRTSFHRTTISLARYFSENCATYIAFVHTVLPWVTVSHGEQQRDGLLELMKSLLGSVDYE